MKKRQNSVIYVDDDYFRGLYKQKANNYGDDSDKI